MALRAVIADDEAGMRLMLRKAVDRTNECETAGEAADGESAFRLVCELKPDVVFLDVEMPVMDGLRCAEQITGMLPMTRIVFVTAHSSYMPEAFRLYAYDYLVKPFNPARIGETIHRIVEEIARREAIGASALQGVPASPNAQSMHAAPETFSASQARIRPFDFRKLMIRGREGIRFVDEMEIVMIAREDRSSVLHTMHGRLVTSDGLNELMERLDPSLFLRCHKSFIINLSKIREITPYGRWTWNVMLDGCPEGALMTHDNMEKLDELFR